MRLTKDEHSIEVDGHRVSALGQTGPIHATWTLSIDGEDVATARATGRFVLRAELPEGPVVEAEVHQSFFGPARVEFRRDGEPLLTERGFVA